MNKYIVERGLGLSSKLGYPTANIEGFKCSPGVYTGETQFGKCVIFVEVGNYAEVHILDFNKDIYGEELEITNVEKLTSPNKGIIYRFNQAFK